ncbi:glycosyltransferase family 61 protein [Caulobacter segnis]
MRVMVGEAAFEKALAARGFAIVRPETMSPSEQVALMREAEVVVGASGAALANAIFLPRGARVVEIQPLNFTSQWVRAACRQVGVDWRGYVSGASPCPARDGAAAGEVPQRLQVRLQAALGRSVGVRGRGAVAARAL